jgi:hypothetical protein
MLNLGFSMALIYEAFYYKVFKLEFKIILSWAMKCRNGKQNFSLRRYYCEKVVKNIPRLEIMIIFFSNVNFLARLEVESYFRFSLWRYLFFYSGQNRFFVHSNYISLEKQNNFTDLMSAVFLVLQFWNIAQVLQIC